MHQHDNKPDDTRPAADAELTLRRGGDPVHIGEIMPIVLAAILARCDRREAQDQDHLRGLDE